MKSANISGRSINLVTGYQNLSELSDKLKPFSYRVLKEDCLDLPDKIYMKREIQLTTEQQETIQTNEKRSLGYIKW